MTARMVSGPSRLPAGGPDRPRGRQVTVRVAMPGSRRLSSPTTPVWVLFAVRVLVILACCAVLGLCEGLLGGGQ